MRFLMYAAATCLLAVGLGGWAVVGGKPGPTPSSTRSTAATPAFVGDFETGNTNQWTWGAQCANTGIPSNADFATGTVTVQSQIVGQGKYAAQFDLPAAEIRNSCETLAKRHVALGTDDYYGLMVRFPDDWQEPSGAGWGLSLAQLNFENVSGAPVILDAHADHISLVMQTGLCRSTSGCAYTSGAGGNVAPMTVAPAPLALGVWHELIIHVHWATDKSGKIEAWHRLQGQTSWKRTVSLRGRPTVQWDEQGPRAIRGSVTADKIGAYRGWARFPVTIWEDGFVRAPTFAAAAARLP